MAHNHIENYFLFKLLLTLGFRGPYPQFNYFLEGVTELRKAVTFMAAIYHSEKI